MIRLRNSLISSGPWRTRTDQVIMTGSSFPTPPGWAQPATRPLDDDTTLLKVQTDELPLAALKDVSGLHRDGDIGVLDHRTVQLDAAFGNDAPSFAAGFFA